MCDRIREDDERNTKIKQSEDLKKCYEINLLLEECLNKNERDFRKCKEDLNALKKCMNYKSEK
jgi:hypothetical protein